MSVNLMKGYDMGLTISYKVNMEKKQSTLKTYFRYLIPSMLGMVLVAVYTFTDTFVVGR